MLYSNQQLQINTSTSPPLDPGYRPLEELREIFPPGEESSSSVIGSTSAPAKHGAHQPSQESQETENPFDIVAEKDSQELELSLRVRINPNVHCTTIQLKIPLKKPVEIPADFTNIKMDVNKWWAGGAKKIKNRDAQKKKKTPAPADAAPVQAPVPVVEESIEGDPVALLAAEYGTTSTSTPPPVTKKRKRRNFGFKKAKKPGDKAAKGKKAMKDLSERSRLEQKVDLKERLGNPIDEMDFIQTRRVTVHLFLHLSKKFGDDVAYDLVGELVDHSRQYVIKAVEEFKEFGSFSDSKSGKTFILPSPIQDQEFRQRLCLYVRENSCPNGAKNLTSEDITTWVNSELGLTGDDQFKSRTVRKWLHDCGFKVTENKKKFYFDGHERADVILDRNRFNEEMQEAKKKTDKINEISLEEIPAPDSTHVRVTQDEKIHHSNDIQARFWSDGTGQRPPPKSQGATAMTSDFYCESFGHVILDEDDLAEAQADPDVGHLFRNSSSYQARKAGSILMVSKDGYYNHQLCLDDFKKASWIVKKKTGKKSIFVTDHSPIHKAMGQDSLDASKMNKGPGGAQPRMRDTVYDGVSQSLVFEDGRAKGLKAVLEERYGEAYVRGKKKDELAEIMSKEPDFMAEKSLLEKEAEERGDIIVFCVKFHPELNPIESVYRDISKFMRENNRVGTTVGYLERIESSYESCGLSVEKVRKYFRSSDRYLGLYMDGATGDNVLEKMAEVRTKHRGAGAVLGEDAPRSSYSREREFQLEQPQQETDSDTDSDSDSDEDE